MKKVFFAFGFWVLSAVLLFSSCSKSGERKAVLRAHFANSKPGDTIILLYATDKNAQNEELNRYSPSSANVASDTVFLDSLGYFTYTTKISEPLHYKIIHLGRLSAVGSGVFLDADTTFIEVDSLLRNNNSVQITKFGPAEQDFLDYQKHTDLLSKKSDSLRKKAEAVTPALRRAGSNPSQALIKKVQAIQEGFFDLYFQGQTLDSQFIVKHSKSVVSAWLLEKFANEAEISPFGKQVVLERIELFLKVLDKSLSKSIYLKGVDKVLKDLRRFSKGAQAPDFKLPTPKGDSVSLSSFRGKVVVLDFWASWCGPCRRLNPLMVELYNKYKDKGVDFLGVSLDDDKAQWLKAIESDKLTWTHVSDLKGWRNQAAVLYEIHAIPATYLIDRDGKIVGNFHGEDLDKALQDLLKK